MYDGKKPIPSKEDGGFGKGGGTDAKVKGKKQKGNKVQPIKANKIQPIEFIAAPSEEPLKSAKSTGKKK